MISPEVIRIMADMIDSYGSIIQDSRNEFYAVNNKPSMVEFLIKAHEYSNVAPLFQYSVSRKFILAPTHIVIRYLVHLLHEEDDRLVNEQQLQQPNEEAGQL